MATSCEDVRARMMELLYGELPDSERAAIEAHLEIDSGGCGRCRAELAGFQSTRAIARQALDETPPARAHDAILRAAEAAAAARVRAPEKRADPARASFWDRLRSGWTLPTLATVGAVAVFLLASKIFLDPEKTYERGRQGLVPAPVEAPAPAPAIDETATPPAAEAQPAAPRPPAPGESPMPATGRKAQSVAPSSTAPEMAAPAERARVREAMKGGGYAGLGGLGTTATSAENRRRAIPTGAAKKKSEAAADSAEPSAVARADRSFAQPPPPRNARPAPVAAADDGDLLSEPKADEASRQGDGRGDGLGGATTKTAAPKATAPAAPAKKGFGGMDDDNLESGGAGSAGPAPAGALAKAAPPREKSAKDSRSAPAPAPPPPASAPVEAKRERVEQASEEDMEENEAPAVRDKSVRKAETPVARADRLFSEGRWAEAAAAYRDLIRRDPRNADAGRWRLRLAAAEAALAPAAAPPP